jgi:hypothetical protein
VLRHTNAMLLRALAGTPLLLGDPALVLSAPS